MGKGKNRKKKEAAKAREEKARLAEVISGFEASEEQATATVKAAEVQFNLSVPESETTDVLVDVVETDELAATMDTNDTDNTKELDMLAEGLDKQAEDNMEVSEETALTPEVGMAVAEEEQKQEAVDAMDVEATEREEEAVIDNAASSEDADANMSAVEEEAVKKVSDVLAAMSVAEKNNNPSEFEEQREELIYQIALEIEKAAQSSSYLNKAKSLFVTVPEVTEPSAQSLQKAQDQLDQKYLEYAQKQRNQGIESDLNALKEHSALGEEKSISGALKPADFDRISQLRFGTGEPYLALVLDRQAKSLTKELKNLTDSKLVSNFDTNEKNSIAMSRLQRGSRDTGFHAFQRLKDQAQELKDLKPAGFNLKNKMNVAFGDVALKVDRKEVLPRSDAEAAFVNSKDNAQAEKAAAQHVAKPR